MHLKNSFYHTSLYIMGTYTNKIKSRMRNIIMIENIIYTSLTLLFNLTYKNILGIMLVLNLKKNNRVNIVDDDG